MKKYLLFVFDDYYPCGGFEDYVGLFDTIELAHEHWKNTAREYTLSNCQIVDCTTYEIVKEDRLD